MPSPHKRSFAAEELARRRKKKPWLWAVVSVVVIAMTVGGISLYRLAVVQKQTVKEQEQIKSIAVLPFIDMSPGKDHEWFCDGITDDIILRLVQIQDLKVISRTSVMLYKNSDKSLPDIGRELGAEVILEGSVRRADNRIRITAQLVRTKDDYHLWAKQYDRDLADIFTVQTEISQAIADELHINLTSREHASLAKMSTVDLEVYDLYLLARNHLFRLENDKALPYIEQILEKDLGFAPAHAAMAHIYNHRGYLARKLHPRDAARMVREEAGKALELDDQCAEAYIELGWTHLYFEWDWEAAEQALKKALSISPNDIFVHHYLRDYYLCVGRMDEAIAETKRVIELDPAGGRDFMLGYDYLWAGKLDEAEEYILRQIEKSEKPDGSYFWNLCTVYRVKGKYQASLDIIHQGLLVRPNNIPLRFELIMTHGYFGETEKARKLLNELLDKIDQMGDPCCFKALCYSHIGELDTAFEWLEKSYRNQETWLSYIKVNPDFKFLLADPRGQELLKRMRLSD